MSDPNTARPGWWNVRKDMKASAVNAILAGPSEAQTSEPPQRIDEDKGAESTRKLRSGKRSTE